MQRRRRRLLSPESPAHYPQAKEATVTDRQRTLNRCRKLDFDMPKAALLETSSFGEVLNAPSVCLERLSLHADCVKAFPDTRVAQRLADGRGGTFLFGPALTACLGFQILARRVDAAPPGGFGQHGRRHGAPKTVCAIILRSVMP